MNDRGPFDRMLDSSAARDRSARTILIAIGVIGAILLIAILAPFSPLKGDGGGGLDETTNSDGVPLPRVPEGYEALSRAYSQKAPDDPGPYVITISLVQPVTDGRNLGFYTNQGGEWERLASATLVNNGAAAQAQLAEVPSNVAVLRRVTSAVHLTGWLPAGAQVDPAALAVLETINPMDYTPGPDGKLVGALSQIPSSDKGLVPTVRAFEAADVDTVNSILGTPQMRDAHIAALVEAASQQTISGLDIDYQRVVPARKPDFTSFITVLAQRLHAANKTLTITLPTPVKAGVTWDTGAYDWEELARQVDAIKLTPEADPSLYHSRMEEVLNFLKAKIDLSKVMLVVNRQSWEKGSDGLRPISLHEALTIASSLEVRTTQPIAPNSSVLIVGKNIFQDDGATGITWDKDAFAVSFSYPGRGGSRTVWMENSLSLAFRLDLARRFGLGGIAVSDVSLNPQAPAFWEPLRGYAETGNVDLAQPNGVLLRPVWQGQAGSIEAGQKGNAVWKAPAQPGAYDVSIVISDGVIRATQKLVLEVEPTSSTTGATPTSGSTPQAGATGTPTPTR